MPGSAEEPARRAAPPRGRTRRVALLVAASLAVAAAVAGSRRAGCSALTFASAETQVRDALARQDRARIEDVASGSSGATAELHPVAFLDAAVAAERGAATVAAMVDAAGVVRWRDQAVELRYLGRERFTMRRCAGSGWCAEGEQLERLRGLVGALVRRHAAQSAGDPELLAPLVSASYRDAGEDREAVLRRVAAAWRGGAPQAAVRAWQIRAERDGAEVGEDVEVDDGAGGRRPRRTLYRLVPAGGGWAFVGGL